MPKAGERRLVVPGPPARRPAGALRGKRAYYRGRGVPPDLVRFYFRRLGDVTRVLDVGCGRGDIGRYRPETVREMCGVDADPRAVEAALVHEDARVLDLEHDALPWDDGTFDAAIAKDVLEHVQRPWELLAEIRRVLRPSGRLLVSVPLPRPHVVWGDYTHVRGFTPAAIAMLLDDCGFRVHGTWRMGGVPGTGRLRLIRWVPLLLRLPPFGWLWASSVEALATRDDD